LTEPAYFDASALAKRYGREAGSAAVAELLDHHVCISSVLASVEVRGAIRRHVEDGLIDRVELGGLLDRLGEDRAHWTLVNLDADVLAEAESLISRHSIRVLDAIHVASARILSTRLEAVLLFVTADRRQGDAAEAVGLTVRRVP